MLKDSHELPKGLHKDNKWLSCDLNPGFCDFRITCFLLDQDR